MKILVGLGNPGPEYEKSRHNAGWQLIDQILADHPEGWKQSIQKNWNAQVWQKQDLLLLKPLTFMNGSGQAVAGAMRFYKVSPAELFVAHDDLDMTLGSYKCKLGVGPKVHNGLLSIYQHLSSEDFWHVRIGVDGRSGERTMPGAAYVLQGFSPKEKPVFQDVLEKISQELWPRLVE